MRVPRKPTHHQDGELVPTPENSLLGLELSRQKRLWFVSVAKRVRRHVGARPDCVCGVRGTVLPSVSAEHGREV